MVFFSNFIVLWWQVRSPNRIISCFKLVIFHNLLACFCFLLDLLLLAFLFDTLILLKLFIEFAMPIGIITIPPISFPLPIQLDHFGHIIGRNILACEPCTHLPRPFRALFPLVAHRPTILTSALPVWNSLLSFSASVVPIIDVELLWLVELMMVLEILLVGFLHIPGHLSDVLRHVRIHVLLVVIVLRPRRRLVVGSAGFCLCRPCYAHLF